METREAKLSVGFVHNGNDVFTAPFARTGSEAEEVYSQTPPKHKLYSWFAEVIAVSLQELGGEQVAPAYLDSVKKGDPKIPAIVKKIPLNDVGGLLIQIQRECWEDEINDQKILCTTCGDSLNADIDLKRIPIPEPLERDGSPYVVTEIPVDLKQYYKIQTGVEALEEWEGLEYNHAIIRVPTLGDAIKHEKLSGDDVQFKRAILFDCMTDLAVLESKIDKNMGVIAPDREEWDVLPSGFISKRGKMLFSKDWSSKTLLAAKNGMFAGLRSMSFYYEDECPCPRRQTIPFFANIAALFRSS